MYYITLYTHILCMTSSYKKKIAEIRTHTLTPIRSPYCPVASFLLLQPPTTFPSPDDIHTCINHDVLFDVRCLWQPNTYLKCVFCKRYKG